MRFLVAIVMLLTLSGCVIKPKAALREPDQHDAVGRQLGYKTSRFSGSHKVIPDIPIPPTWEDVLERAFRTNGDLEAAFHEWAMAVERIDQAGTWPTSNLEIGFDYMLSSERMKTFNRMTISAGLMDTTALPNKVFENASVAWHEAQAAGERFRAKKFDLQMRVLQAWADYALQSERVRVQEENLDLLTLMRETAIGRVISGDARDRELRIELEITRAENELATARSILDQQRVSLNAMLRRPPDAILPPPDEIPLPRLLSLTDDELLSAGVTNNPELAALGYDADARQAAIRRAQLEYWPEVNPMAAFTGSVSQSLGAAIMIPTQLPRIRAMIAESRAELWRIEASLAQAKTDRAGRFLLTLIAMRDAERRTRVFQHDILPLARQIVDLTRRRYESGFSTYSDLIDAQRTFLDVRLMSAEAATQRERMLAEIEALAGMDAETIHPSTRLTIQPAQKEIP